METLFERMTHPQQAHARSTDPETSHMAAASVTPGLTEIQRQVETYALSRPEGFLDAEMVKAFDPLFGPSTLRTRRAELTSRNIILDSMRRAKPFEASTPHTIWIHRSFVVNAPPLIEPEAPASNRDKAEGLRMADELDKGAKQMRSEGRTGFADQLVEAAAILRRLAH